MILENNPLKQYFRRPSIFIKLPSGGKDYDESVIDMPSNGEIPVYPMTALDEISARTPDALYNGTAIVDLISSCVPNIKDPWKISNVDMDTVLIGIKTASQGNNIEISTVCPKCNEDALYNVNLISFLPGMKAPDFSNELSIGDLSIKFKALTFKQMNEASLMQFELQKIFNDIQNISDEGEKIKKNQQGIKTITDTTMKLISNTIEYIKTPSSEVSENLYILDFIRNCDKQTYETIRDYYTTIKAQSEIKPLKIKCVHCEHEYEQQFTLNISDFFG